MNKVLKVTIITIIAFLCITICTYTNAENETTETETPVQTETNNEENESNQNEENNPSDSDENTSQEENNDNEQEQSNQPETQETQTDDKPASTSTGTSQSTTRTTPRQQNPVQKQSSNASLINLGMNPNDFKGFKPWIYTYNVTVPNDVESVNVYAKTQDTKARITSGIGNHNLDIGSNDISVIVTAEDGSTQTYTINVTREEKAEEVEDNPTSQIEQNEYDLKKLEIKGYKLSPEFSGNTYEYKLNVNSDVTELEVITEGLNDKINIEVVGNTDLKERRKHYYNFSCK
ncbi:MAG TPA: hypothetical protein DEP51_00325 [Clostridiales bacterium]|nr:hypothetical protein [Clostridiales bacterium]